MGTQGLSKFEAGFARLLPDVCGESAGERRNAVYACKVCFSFAYAVATANGDSIRFAMPGRGHPYLTACLPQHPHP